MSAKNIVMAAAGGVTSSPYWISYLGKSGTEYGNGIAVDSLGYIYVAGVTDSEGGQFSELLISKYDPLGAIQWQRRLGGSGSETGKGVALDSSRNVYVVGITASQGAGNNDLLLAKFDTNGSLLWQRSLGGGSFEYGEGVSVDSSGNVYVVGYSNSLGGYGDYDMLLAKYDSSGVLQWQRRMGGASADFGNGIAVTGPGAVYITGHTNSQGAGANDAVLARYDSSGVLQWQRRLGTAVNEYAWGVAFDSGGNPLIVGSYNPVSGGSVAFIARYNSDGTLLWQRKLVGPSQTQQVLYSISVNSLGEVYAVGTVNFTTSGNSSILIVKYNLSGVLQWQRYLGATSYANAIYASVVATAGSIYVGGSVSGQGPGSAYELFVARLPADGSLGGPLGRMTYGYTSLIESADSMTAATATLSEGASSLTDAARTLTDAATTLVSYTLPLPVPFWVNVIGGSSGDYINKLAVNPTTQDVYACGVTASQGAGGTDALLLKFNAAGALQWQRSLGGAFGEFGYGVAVDSSGNAYIAGYSTSADSALLAKFDTSGALTWQVSLDGSNSERFLDVAVEPGGGNVYVCGISTTPSNGVAINVIVAKYNSSGALQWQRRAGTSGTAYGFAIAVDINNNVYVAGYTSEVGAGGNDALLLKYDSSGTLQWQRIFGGTLNEEWRGVAVDSTGSNVYAVGSTTSGGFRAILAKFNSSGTIQWQRDLGAISFADYGYGVAVDNLGGVTVTGYAGFNSDDAFVVQYDSNGTEMWARAFNGAASDQGYSIAIDIYGALYVAGYTTTQGSGSSDAYIARLPANGAGVGPYGSMNYVNFFANTATSTFTVAATSIADAATTLTASSASFTSGVRTLTNTKYNMPSYWIATLSGSSSEQSRGIAVDASGNVYSVVITQSQTLGASDMLLLKHKASGALEWQQRIGGTGNDVGSAVSLDSSGNIYIAGSIESEVTTSSAFVAKFNSAGVLQWQKSYGRAGVSEFNVRMVADSAGNIYVSTCGIGVGFLLFKCNTSGAIQWQRQLSSAGIADGIAVDVSGNVYAVGDISNGTQIFVVKYDGSGVLQWQRFLNSGYAESVAVDQAGSVYIGGWTGLSGAGSTDQLLVKYNSSGVLQWQRVIGDADSDSDGRVALDASGYPYICGRQNASGGNLHIVKYTSSGTILWQRTFGQNALDGGPGFCIDQYDNIYVNGYSYLTNSDVFVAKLPPDGLLTGVYGVYTYGTASLTGATSSLTDSAGTFTDSAGTATDAVRTLTNAPSTLTSATFMIQG